MSDSDDAAATARRLWRLLEPIHAVTYFSPEPLAALRAAGYRGFWMGYFAGRAAPLGRASAELTHAVFYNFASEHVRRAIPDAWDLAAPEAALAARLDGSVAALRRHLGTGPAGVDPVVERAAEVATRAAAAAPLEGRPLFAANRALPVPAEPLARLWHAATLLREHRGDGHVAALVAAGIGGRESHVLHALATGTPADVYALARRLGPEEWAAIRADFAARGLVGDAGHLSAAGRELKERVEAQTDRAAATAYAGLDEAEVEQLAGDLRPIAAAVVAAGEIPARSPMGLDLDEIG
ncbi:hypothetical protein [Nocardioides sp.]|uniref:SCO6745 family protein n=1 Tax=Nocardioides sp. TaxID=35761 RepID=UPI0025F6BF65|nr:hypothetical protein [Nocardioides sp.]